jgi:hypothetical protein
MAKYQTDSPHSTETGQLMTSFRPEGDKNWDYQRILDSTRPYIRMKEISPGFYECIVLDGLKSKVVSNSDDPPNSFHTRDMFIAHPTIPEAYKYLGRLDDRVTLMNGEKVLPLPIEGRVRKEELVQEAVVFGVGKVVPGIIVFRSEKSKGLSNEEFLERIWPAVQDANSRAEAFSQISKEMVVLVPEGEDYPRTEKGTFIRPQIYKKYERLIEAAYDAFENGQAGTLVLDIPQLEEFILTHFREDLGVTLESSQSDFFAAGVDSLQAIKMWGWLKRELDLGGQQALLSQNIVYEKPNAAELARHLYAMRTGAQSDSQDVTEVMKELVEKYSLFKDHVPGDLPQPEDNVVVSSTKHIDI